MAQPASKAAAVSETNLIEALIETPTPEGGVTVRVRGREGNCPTESENRIQRIAVSERDSIGEKRPCGSEKTLRVLVSWSPLSAGDYDQRMAPSLLRSAAAYETTRLLRALIERMNTGRRLCRENRRVIARLMKSPHPDESATS